MKRRIAYTSRERSLSGALLVLSLACLLAATPPAAPAAPAGQDDPAAQCAEGLRRFDEGKSSEALPLLEAGFAGRERATFPHPDDLGDCALILGRLRNEYGQYGSALEAYSVALAIFRQSNNQLREGSALSQTGMVYAHQGQYTAALDTLQQALTLRREIGDRQGEGQTWDYLGSVYQSQGRYEQAINVYEQALAIAREAGNREAESATLHNLGSVALAQGRYEQAFQAYQESLAIVREVDDHKGEGATLHYLGLVYKNQGRYEQAKQMFQEALTIAQEVGDQNGASNVLNSMGLLYNALGQHQRAVEMYRLGLDIARKIGDHKDEGTILNNIGGFHLNQGEYEQARDQFEQALVIARQIGNRSGEETALNNMLIRPLASRVKTWHLAIVPHGVLHYLPFAALSDGRRFLIDDHVLSVLPSASSLAHIKQNAVGRTPAPPLILGNPATVEPGLDPLPYAEREARAVADLYQTVPLLGAAATEGALRQQVAQAGLVHLAAHGRFDAGAPLASVVYLAPDALGPEGATTRGQDGRLEVGEIYGLDLGRADLVVLSACETQRGALSAGDELVGLTRAFFFARTPSVIATLWKVDDRATGLLMERFHTYLRAGMSKGEALQQAQLSVRETYPNPSHWAAFVLSGDAGASTLPVDSQPSLWPWLAGGALVVAGATTSGVALARRRVRRTPSDGDGTRAPAQPSALGGTV